MSHLQGSKEIISTRKEQIEISISESKEEGDRVRITESF